MPPPGGLTKPLRSKILKPRNLVLAEGSTRAELGGYNFDKAAKELSSKYGLSNISNKYVLVDWKDYDTVYSSVKHKIPTNLFINLMKEGGEVEVKVGTGKSSLIMMVTTESEFAREEGTPLVTYQNSTLDSEGGWDKSTIAKGEVGSPMLRVVVGFKVKVGYVLQEGVKIIGEMEDLDTHRN